MSKNDKQKTYSMDTKVNKLLSKMTLEEKIAQLGSVGPEKILENGKFSPQKASKVLKNGIGQISRIAGASALPPKKAARAANNVQKFLIEETRLGIPAIIHEECLSGFMGKGGTTYPQSIGMASTWEPELMEQITSEIKKQLRAIGASLALSPLADVARDPRWGRIEETFGEDQYLVAEMAVAYVKGLQGEELSEGVCATLKHFVGHGYCEGGRNHAPVNISERELRENFLFPFEAVIKKVGAGSVMNAYHDIDGTPCASSKKLLTDILRGEWNFEGIVVSDYFSIEMLCSEHNTAANKQQAGINALEAGLDIELPETSCYDEKLIEAVKIGLISEEVINESVRRHLQMKFRLGLFENSTAQISLTDSVFETKEQRKLARQAARKSIVLLKNENNLLPLDKDINSLAVIGPSANSTRNLLGDYAYSAHVDSKEDAIPIVDIFQGIKNKVGDNTELNFAPGCSIMGESQNGFSQAVKTAQNSDVALLVLGGKSGLSGMGGDENEDSDSESVDFAEVSFSTEIKETSDTTGEHHDRTNLKLPGVQQELLQEIYKTGTPIVLVLVNGRPLAIEWASQNIPGILETWLPGEEGGNAVADVIFGDFNPGGKLPVSIPKNTGQLPINYNRKPMSHNRDYVFADNRPLFPFGYGLSYTNFKYKNIETQKINTENGLEIEIEIGVENTGKLQGEEIVQLYINDPIASRTRPIKELKAFQRVSIQPGETKRIEFILNSEQLAFYNENMELCLEEGKYNILIGSSSEDIRLKDCFEIKNTRIINSNFRKFFSKTSIHN